MTIVILDNIRSAHNVGSIFRTCDGAGVEKLLLCGTTPTPIDRFGRARADIAKVALGAENTVSWEYFSTTTDAIVSLKNEGVRVIGIEQTQGALDYMKLEVAGPMAFVFGNEVGGVSQEALALCDEIAHIPMRGAKESLNVSVAAGIILFRQ